MSLFDLPPATPDPDEAARKRGKATRPPPSSATRSTRATPGRGPGSDAPNIPSAPSAPVVGVSELTARIAGQLSGMGRLVVEGEVSALKRAGSGHVYFNLKDAKASLSCAIWKSRVGTGVKFDLQDGQQVLCHGRLDVYAPRGNYSLIVERVERRGLGELLARLERLKAELRERGWFDRKRPLPSRPLRIGLVTSRDADALRDFLRTRSLRWPGYPVRLCHTRVQGPQAAQEIARAIARLDDGSVDVICVVRGGGSLEDLWAFNELPVAEAVWASSVPVISGVGHESDTTLIDYVADWRAHTPTNAAEQAIPDRGVWWDRLDRISAYLETAILRHLQVREERVARLAARPSLRSARSFLEVPWSALQERERRLKHGIERTLAARQSRLDQLNARFSRSSPMARLAGLTARLQALAPRLDQAMHQRILRSEARLKEQERVLAAISPLAVLGRGYSLVERVASDGEPASGPRIVRDAADLTPGDRLQITLARGRTVAEVQRVERARAEADEAQGNEEGNA